MPRQRKDPPLKALEVARLSEAGLHFVGEVPGLALQVLPTGGKTWILRMMIAGKRRDMGLGGYPAVTLAQAKERAREARDKVRQGIDPIQALRQAQSTMKAAAVAALTFEQCASRYITTHEPGWRNAKHGQQWRNTLETYAYPVMGPLMVADVAKEHVLAVLTPIWADKTETASRLRSRIELVLSYAMQAGYRPEGLNPARWRGGLDKLLPAPGKVAKQSHHAALPVGEVGAFMARLREAEGMGARALEFVILTAARSGEVRAAVWAEFDREGKVWTVPASRMKAGKEHRVPLSAAALDLLARVEAMPKIGDGDMVFPAPRGGLLSDMTLSAVLRRMQVPAVPHGFRSTFRDWVAERTSYPNEVAEMALAHAIGDKVEAAYRRGDLFEKRARMMEDWAAFLAAPEAKGTVIPLKHKRA